MVVLGIESSCDELACGVLADDGHTLLANVVHSQVVLHQKFGGVVPEIASRNHVAMLSTVFERTMREAEITASQLDGIAVTRGPGLIGSLLCGVEFAKGLALASKKPLIGVHHLEGHIAAALLEDPPAQAPFIALLVSGGHTSLVKVAEFGGPYEIMGATRDDAAGEAFDKTAKLLGLAYPGGATIDRLGQDGDSTRFSFPTMMAAKNNLDFSFSGLKTAASKQIRDVSEPLDGQNLKDFCASFQKAIVENLSKKTFRALELCGYRRLVVGGGVAANRLLRHTFQTRAEKENIEVFLPSPKNCTDNGAMIAKAGWERLRRGERHGLDLSARAQWPLGKLSGG